MTSHLAYDRRIDEKLLKLMKGRGPLAWLPRMAMDWPHGRPTDLGLRKSTGESWVTLYVGTTQAVNIKLRHKDGSVTVAEQRFGGDVSAPGVAFDPAWSGRLSREDLRRDRARLEAHVKAVVKVAPEGRMHEGRAQALLGRSGDRTLAVVDREVEFSRAHAAAKRFVKKQQRELQKITRAAKPPGDKIDALAIGARNRLFVIEVKPGNAPTLADTPLQVAMYARLVRAWGDDDEDRAIEVVNEMGDQREALGLLEPGAPRLKPGFAVSPVIAVGLPIAARSKKPGQLDMLRDQINAATGELEQLEVWTIGGVTRMAKPSLAG